MTAHLLYVWLIRTLSFGMLRAYLTEREEYGSRWAGPLIWAGSWDEAERLAAKRGVKVVGELRDEVRL